MLETRPGWVPKDIEETFAPDARLESIRILLAIVYSLKFKLYQMDVKSTSSRP